MRKDAKNVMVVDTRSVNMSIYTRTGDNGTTSLFGGKRLLKSDLLIDTYGTIDELSSFLGLLFLYTEKQGDKKRITAIQKDLYLIMGYLAGAKISLSSFPKQIIRFEKDIDMLEKKLPVLHRFTLPQGSQLSIHAHLCRTICRRAERMMVKYAAQKQPRPNDFKCILSYLNRLSDYLYIKAREFNQHSKGEVKI